MNSTVGERALNRIDLHLERSYATDDTKSSRRLRALLMSGFTVCVCVCVRERDKETAYLSNNMLKHTLLFSLITDNHTCLSKMLSKLHTRTCTCIHLYIILCTQYFVCTLVQ